MLVTIEIELECSDEDVLADVIQHLELVLPYMTDNVIVKSAVQES